MQEKWVTKPRLAAMVCIALAFIAGGLWDLQLDIWLRANLYQPLFAPAVFMESYGWLVMYLPAVLLLALGACKKSWHWLARTGCVLGTFLGLFVLDYMVNHYLEKRAILTHSFAANIVVGVGVTVVLVVILRRISESNRIKLTFFSLCGTVYLLADAVVINLIKKLWQRTRFDDMLAGGDTAFAQFTAWWHPLGNGGSSFPSGHTAAACGIFVLLVLCSLYPCWAKHKKLVWTLSIIYVLFMAAMRLVIGRHYLSDTAAAILIKGVLLVVLMRLPIYKTQLQKCLAKADKA